jgi:PAS domain S-box-containing protein
MAERIAAYDWASTSIGAPVHWSSTLQILVDTVMRSPYPMLIWWGPEFIQLYNDAYIALVGARHPQSLGQAASACWPEIWNTVGPILQDVVATGVPFKGNDTHFVLERNGYPEDAYFTFSYSRIGGADDCGGVLCTNMETTVSVKRDQQFRAMADNIANIIYTHSASGAVEWANLRWYEYTQLPREIATTFDGWKEVVPAEDLDVVLQIIQRAFIDGEPYEAEMRLKPYNTGDDRYRWHLLRARPMRRGDGVIERWAGSATDIHDRRIAEEAVRRSLEADLLREREASLAFQNAALPQHLPQVGGLTFDAIYEAAGGKSLVGGDWYDAFRLGDGRIVLSVGDVIGNGLNAAVTMSAARQAIRGAAQVYPEPAAVLDAADRALRSEQPDRIVTVFLGIFDPVTLDLAYASAGHPPPFLRLADGTIQQLASADLPLGLRHFKPSIAQQSIHIPCGSLLALYTDGLTESNRDILQGEQAVREALGRPEVQHADRPAAALRKALSLSPNDDVAILVMQVGARPAGMHRWCFDTHDGNEASIVRRSYAEVLRVYGAQREYVDDAELILGELLGNVLRHTNGAVEVALDVSGEDPVLHVLDRGQGFTFYARLPQDGMSESGRGIFIVSQLARDLSIVPRSDGGSHARVVLNAHRQARVGQ